MFKIISCLFFVITTISAQTQKGLCSHYGGKGFEGTKTSCGVIYHDHEITAASNTLPCGSKAKVTLDAPYAGHSVVVTVTNTGGFAPGVVMDLNTGAMNALGIKDSINGIPHCTVTKV